MTHQIRQFIAHGIRSNSANDPFAVRVSLPAEPWVVEDQPEPQAPQAKPESARITATFGPPRPVTPSQPTERPVSSAPNPAEDQLARLWRAQARSEGHEPACWGRPPVKVGVKPIKRGDRADVIRNLLMRGWQSSEKLAHAIRTDSKNVHNVRLRLIRHGYHIEKREVSPRVYEYRITQEAADNG